MPSREVTPRVTVLVWCPGHGYFGDKYLARLAHESESERGARRAWITGHPQRGLRFTGGVPQARGKHRYASSSVGTDCKFSLTPVLADEHKYEGST